MRFGCRTSIPRPSPIPLGQSTNITNILQASERPMLGEPIFRSGTAAIVAPERNWRTKAMRNVFKSVFLVCLATWAASVSAQTTSFRVFNFPPCDFSDNFYTEVGFDASKLSTMGFRFGDARLTGAPAFLPGQVNWVTDGNCSVTEPNRRNVRILPTTGAYKDDT